MIKMFGRYFNINGSWKYGVLNEIEEGKIEEETELVHDEIFQRCIDRALKLVSKNFNGGTTTDILNVARSLFEKTASHVVFKKEEVIKEYLGKHADSKETKLVVNND